MSGFRGLGDNYYSRRKCRTGRGIDQDRHVSIAEVNNTITRIETYDSSFGRVEFNDSAHVHSKAGLAGRVEAAYRRGKNCDASAVFPQWKLAFRGTAESGPSLPKQTALH